MADNYYTEIRDVITDAFDIIIKDMDKTKLTKEQKKLLEPRIIKIKTIADSMFVELYSLGKSIVDDELKALSNK